MNFRNLKRALQKRDQSQSFDPNIRRKIGLLRLNEIVQTTNRHGKRTTIRITNITELSWENLQALSIPGEDSISKMIALHEIYSNPDARKPSNSFTQQEVGEVDSYIAIFNRNQFSTHIQVNDYIDSNDLWDSFPTIRSLNDHAEYKGIRGIQPKYFAAICCLLGISGQNGHPIDSYRSY